ARYDLSVRRRDFRTDRGRRGPANARAARVEQCAWLRSIEERCVYQLVDDDRVGVQILPDLVAQPRRRDDALVALGAHDVERCRTPRAALILQTRRALLAALLLLSGHHRPQLFHQ